MYYKCDRVPCAGNGYLEKPRVMKNPKLGSICLKCQKLNNRLLNRKWRNKHKVIHKLALGNT